MRHCLPVFAFLLLLIGCNSRPEGVLSRSKMEDVLHDYHIAQGMVTMLSPEERYQEQAYIDAVFRKHGITEAVFDSSMIWYNRHGEELLTIYDHLSERFEDEDKAIQAQTGTNYMSAMISEGGDTTNIWSGDKLFVLQKSDWLNHRSFSMAADTSFHRNDRFLLMADCHFAATNRMNNASKQLVMSVSIEYDNDDVISELTRVYANNGAAQVSIESSKPQRIRHINGFFYYINSTPDDNAFLVVSNVKLYRVHKQESQEPTENADSVTINQAAPRPDMAADSASLRKPMPRPSLPASQEASNEPHRGKKEIVTAPSPDVKVNRPANMQRRPRRRAR